MIRYLKSSKMYITLRDGDNDGAFYPPYLKLEYDTVSLDQYGTPDEVEVGCLLFAGCGSSGMYT